MGEMVKSFPSESGTENPSTPGSFRTGSNAESRPGDAPGREVIGEAKEVASRVADQAKDLARTQVTQRAGRSAEELNDVARALRQTKDQLGENFAAPYVDKAADQIERFSSFLREADARQMVRSVETFARREPLLFLGGAFALGLLGARFLKSSARHVDRDTWETGERRGPGSSDYRSRGFGSQGYSSRDYGSREQGFTGQGSTTPRYGTTGRTGDTLHGVGPVSSGSRGREIPINAPEPSGDYPPNEPGEGPYPGGGAGRAT